MCIYVYIYVCESRVQVRFPEINMHRQSARRLLFALIPILTLRRQSVKHEIDPESRLCLARFMKVCT